MTTTWYLTIKPAFLNELMALPVKEIAQVNKKLQLLAQDPTPDAKTKKRLKGVTALHRLRSGDYRIFYTYQEPYVSVLSVRMRDEGTYDGMPEAELLGGAPEGDAPGDAAEAAAGAAEPAEWKRWLAPPAAKSTPLGRPITEELLTGLAIDARFHAALTKIDSEEALLDCTTVPPSTIDRLIDAVTGRPLEQIAQQPDLRLDGADDLLRYREGGLLGFLLRLSPEQESGPRRNAEAQASRRGRRCSPRLATAPCPARPARSLRRDVGSSRGRRTRVHARAEACPIRGEAERDRPRPPSGARREAHAHGQARALRGRRHRGVSLEGRHS